MNRPMRPSDCAETTQEAAHARALDATQAGALQALEKIAALDARSPWAGRIARGALKGIEVSAPNAAPAAEVVAGEPFALAPFTTPDADLNRLLDATVWLAKGPAHNNMDTGMDWYEGLQIVLDRLAAPGAAINAREQEDKAQTAINAIAALAPVIVKEWPYAGRYKCQQCRFEWGGDMPPTEAHANNCAYVIATSVPHTPPASREQVCDAMPAGGTAPCHQRVIYEPPADRPNAADQTAVTK